MLIKKLLINGIILFTITACVSPDMRKAKEIDVADAKFRQTLPKPNADYGKYPKDYKVLIKNYMNKQLKDPDSAKYSEFSKPRKEHVIYKAKSGIPLTEGDVYYGYSSCVQVNAKNSYGGYTGNQAYWFFFYNNEVMRVQKISELNMIYIGRPINCQNG
ncbi:hypothetical protein [Actinobacillus pleuropneumoniae]|uniref:hypothetical protein n=1 Tax=Actinobacillus pleuropneumoniae TaxID=715 RepID=UPI0001DF7EC9|nr:hypothetical protein [Actinobacillus pleuropneumoniae]EFL80900.1 hypothetical protein APP6_1831 [Actinobacillus pleuropneumoniae serovar 6 str. Femo]UKH13205.1 hypothetical protein D1099_03960 [Actinobacillus pleuropneumoniae serovar 6 str. Femo]UKH16209.1 hypothetical protein D1111_03315 [Actinobacillus pleuropneumoniae]SUU62373.1 Uncharacterised protein [Actinobacillus pleuropneumoniae]